MFTNQASVFDPRSCGITSPGIYAGVGMPHTTGGFSPKHFFNRESLREVFIDIAAMVEGCENDNVFINYKQNLFSNSHILTRIGLFFELLSECCLHRINLPLSLLENLVFLCHQEVRFVSLVVWKG